MHRRAGVALALVGLLAACHPSKQYETDVEITRIAAVRKDDASKVLTLDFEVSYVDCPGTQLEVFRGDAAFAACVTKYKVGEKVHLSIDHTWTPEGLYKSTVTSVGDCRRIPDPADEASYAMVRECDDWLVNGQKVGFQCRYIPEQKLVDQCPWFRRR
jgi:hypothetical protein